MKRLKRWWAVRRARHFLWAHDVCPDCFGKLKIEFISLGEGYGVFCPFCRDGRKAMQRAITAAQIMQAERVLRGW